jgi:hypothetical protein
MQEKWQGAKWRINNATTSGAYRHHAVLAPDNSRFSSSRRYVGNQRLMVPNEKSTLLKAVMILLISFIVAVPRE